MNPPRWKKVTKRTKLMSDCPPPTVLFIYDFIYLLNFVCLFIYYFFRHTDQTNKIQCFFYMLASNISSFSVEFKLWIHRCVHCRFVIYFRNRAINLWTNSFHKNNIVQKNANAVVKSAFVFEINNENVCSVLVGEG